MEEIWAEIEGYPIYHVSNLGRIKNTRTGRIKKKVPNKDGYYLVGVFHNRIKKTYAIARLVGKYFVPNPNNLPEINHIDFDKKNDVWTNLEWTTRLGNMKHAYAAKTMKRKKVYAYNNETKEVTEFASNHDCSRHFKTSSLSNTIKKGFRFKKVYTLFHEAEWHQFKSENNL